MGLILPPAPAVAKTPPTKFIVFDDFSGGMNTQSGRQGLPEKQPAWLENLQPVAPNYLLGVPAPASSALATLANETVVRQFYFDLGLGSDLIVNFCASGAAYTVTNPGGTVVKFAAVGTFSATGGDVTLWNGKRILIADSMAGYCTYDGTLFARQGGVSPNFAVTAAGSGYNAGATAVISGGSGSGATATVQISGGAVVGLTLTNSGTGYLAGDTLTVTISPVAGGSGATASAHVWPFVTPAPTTVSEAFGRVWLAQGRTLIVTGTGASTFGEAYDDFATGDASVTTTISDSDLVHRVTALRYLNGALYILGDNSVKSISSITVSGGTTNFTILPLTSDQGTVFQQTVISFNRLVIFANSTGVFAVFGASVEKISGAMDGIFRGVIFTQPPVAAVCDINNIRTLLLLVKYRDPTSVTRALLLAYFDRKWFVVSQGNSLLTIVTGVVNGVTSSASDVFGSSGSDVTQLLSNTSSPLAWKLQTSLTPHGNPIMDKRIVRAGIAETATGVSDLDIFLDSERGSVDAALANQSAALTIVNNAGQPLTFVNNSGQVLTFVGQGFILAHTASASQTGRYIGATLTGTLNGVALQAVFLEYADASKWGRG